MSPVCKVFHGEYDFFVLFCFLIWILVSVRTQVVLCDVRQPSLGQDRANEQRWIIVLQNKPEWGFLPKCAHNLPSFKRFQSYSFLKEQWHENCLQSNEMLSLKCNILSCRFPKLKPVLSKCVFYKTSLVKVIIFLNWTFNWTREIL